MKLYSPELVKINFIELTTIYNVIYQMMDRLKQGLNVYGIEYSETLFTEVEDVGDSPYVRLLAIRNIFISY